jgi:hypothetical protein
MLAPWLLGFVPVTYLGLAGGGYDIVARSEVAIALWWIVLVGSAAGVLPRATLTRGMWTAMGLLTLFLAWTWIATGWTSSRELTLDEAARVASYLGVLVLAALVIDRRSVSALLSGVGAAIALVCTLAVLSRLVPSWFPSDSGASFYATVRLRYPFDYSDGLGEFAALGLPLLLYLATSLRSLAGRAAAAAGLPAVVLCLALTVSRGGILAAAVGIIALFALAPDRFSLLASTLVAVCTSAAGLVAIGRRVGVREVLHASAAPAGERHAVLAVVVLICTAAALLQIGVSVALRDGRRPRWLLVSRRRARTFAAVLGVAVLGLIVAGVAAGTVHHLWVQFKKPNAPAGGSEYARLLSISGSHRYQYWQVAVAANHTSPWRGIGPGTFRFYWAEHQKLGEYVLNAHSLWIETLAVLGIIGLTLLGGFALFVLGRGSARALRAPPTERWAVAAAVATFAGFCAAAAFDWVWQLGAIAFVAMLVAAAALTPELDVGPATAAATPVPSTGERRRSALRSLAPRFVLSIGAIVALWAILIPLADTIEVRASQGAAARGDLRTALADAVSAARLEPSAATPRLQEALVLERLGDVTAASQAISQAIAREHLNWSLWLVASRLATERDRAAAALADYRRARSLNPTSPIFAK